MLRDINRALSSAMDAVSDKLDESLARSRNTVIGQVDVQGVIKHLFSPVAVHPGIRQTHLARNGLEYDSLSPAETNLASTEAGVSQSGHDSLSRRGAVDQLPVDKKCQRYLEEKVLTAAEHAHKWIVQEVCTKAGCFN